MDKSIIALHAVTTVDLIYYSAIKHWACTRSAHAELKRQSYCLLFADAFLPLQCLLPLLMHRFPPTNLGGWSFLLLKGLFPFFPPFVPTFCFPFVSLQTHTTQKQSFLQFDDMKNNVFPRRRHAVSCECSAASEIFWIQALIRNHSQYFQEISAGKKHFSCACFFHCTFPQVF